ncbi:MAG: 2-phosphosulfolactate phosphatase [Calditrichaeota bacterium]|nr:MAG: 2-phosphosulfolactate phosphatase [Calditrichota bacterium]
MRQLRFYPAADAVSDTDIVNTVAVVADVLRATSTIVTALYNGCKTVIPVKEIDEALAVAAELPSGQYILGGERQGKRIPGFMAGNSPQDFDRVAVADKIVITTTTNGTRALVNCAAAEKVFVLSFLNLTAIAESILKLGNDVSMVAAGIYGDFSLEDSVCCGFLMNELLAQAHGEFELTEEAQRIAELARTYKGHADQLLLESPHGQYLCEIGYASDLAICADINKCPVVAVYQNGRINIVQ